MSRKVPVVFLCRFGSLHRLEVSSTSSEPTQDMHSDDDSSFKKQKSNIIKMDSWPLESVCGGGDGSGSAAVVVMTGDGGGGDNCVSGGDGGGNGGGVVVLVTG
uniref:Uncharacterized protein n=1 Tax=Lactuca sativa TaxID=4236 RepID=A0A9R1V4W5_LACSA|nr:hypothetical protein LSAT_V11C600312960 [Lactuca sativa]